MLNRSSYFISDAKLDVNSVTFSKGDVNAYFGLLFDGLAKVLIAVGTLTQVIGMPAEFVYTRILPGLALAVFIGNAFYAYEANKLSARTGKKATAQPFGVGAAQVFGWLFLIIGPVYWSTNDYVLAWQIGIAAAFIGGVIELVGSLVGERLRRAIPRSALMGNLAANGFVWLTVVGFITVFENPFVALFPALVLLVIHYGRLDSKLKIPSGLLVVLIGTALAWLTGQISLQGVTTEAANLSLNLPVFAGVDVFTGLENVAPYLPVIIPLQLCNFLTTLQCIQSAKMQGDEYSVKLSMTADGSSTIIGSLFGNPFPTTMYYGHTTWKGMGAGSSYSLLVGLTYIVFCFSGLIAVISAIIPYETTVTLLILVGVTTATAMISKVNEEYSLSFLIALVPIFVQYMQSFIDGLFAALGLKLTPETFDTIMAGGVNFDGLIKIGQGGFMTSLLLACVVAYIVKTNFRKAAIFMGLMAISTFVGLIHNATPELFPAGSMAIGQVYLIITAGLFILSKYCGDNQNDTLNR